MLLSLGLGDPRLYRGLRICEGVVDRWRRPRVLGVMTFNHVGQEALYVLVAGVAIQ